MHRYLLATDLVEKAVTISRDLKQNLNVVNEEVHNIPSMHISLCILCCLIFTSALKIVKEVLLFTFFFAEGSQKK